MPTILQDLWGYPMYGAHFGKGLCVDIALGASEVRQLHAELQVYEHVGPLQISVNDDWVLLVQVIQALEDTTCGLHEKLALQRPKLVDHPSHGATGHILQVYVEAAVDKLMSHTGNNMPMPQILANIKLLLKLIAKLFSVVIGYP
jgi:hypothetical protein